MASKELTSTDLSNLLQFSIDLAKRAGDVMRQGSVAIQTGSVEEKKNAVDLVTEWDVKVEELVKSEIQKQYPGFDFIGEESYVAGKRPPLRDTPTFCVDPIDGTTNFVHGFPISCISIGLLYKKQPVIGVIYSPFLNQMFYGLKGHGAYTVPVTSSGTSEPRKLPIFPAKPLPSLSEAVIGIEWGSDRSSAIMSKKTNSFLRLAGDPKEIKGGKMAQGLRSIGSAALNYSYVSQGAQDMYWEIGCWPWDVCAGIAIALEAGCYVTSSREYFLAHRDEDPLNISNWDEFIWSRKYIVVRAIADTPNEKGRDAQKRLVEDFYNTVEDWDPV